jgi:hypothetical protein
LTCCRRTRFSASSVALALKREARIPRISLNRSVIRMRAYAVRLLRLRRIEFSVHTGWADCSNATSTALRGPRVRTPGARRAANCCRSMLIHRALCPAARPILLRPVHGALTHNLRRCLLGYKAEKGNTRIQILKRWIVCRSPSCFGLSHPECDSKSLISDKFH